MTEPWFFLPALASTGDDAQLTGDEAHHASAVRRLHAGDAITLFDGRGNLARATVTTANARRREVMLAVTARTLLPPPHPRVHLYCALPKGERLATLLDMGTQLGMTSFTPLACEYSVAKATDGFIARAQRICLEACKQSRRAWLPSLRAATTPAQAATQAAKDGDLVLLAEPGGNALEHAGKNHDRPTTILIGPEGGFSEAELAAMRAAGARQVTFGEGILRIETAAVAALATLRVARERGEDAIP